MKIKNTYTNNSTYFIRLHEYLKLYQRRSNVSQLHDEKESRDEGKNEQKRRYAHSDEQYNELNFLYVIQNCVFISDGQ